MDRKKADDEAPEILKYTSSLLEESPGEADPKADMLLLFLASGFTILGALGGTYLASFVAHRDATLARSLFTVLAGAGLGGVVGCGFGLLILGMRGLVRWEKTRGLDRRS